MTEQSKSVVSSIRPASLGHKLVLNSDSAEKSQFGYDKWSSQYDGDLTGVGYKLPKLAAQVCMKYASNAQSTSILDLGAGTAMLAESLRNDCSFVGEIDILDANMEMLYMGCKKGLKLRNVIRHWIDGPLPLRPETYDVVFCIGAIAVQHCPPATIPAMFEMAKPGGLLIVNISPSLSVKHDSDLETFIEEMQSSKQVTLLEKSIHEVYNGVGRTIIYTFRKN